MRNLEECFIKEFKASYFTGTCTDIYKVPVPSLGGIDKLGKPIPSEKLSLVSGTDLFAIRGIERDYYKDLNLSVVKKLPSGFKARRRKINKATRGFQLDSEGKPVYEDFPVPKNTMVILSKKNINLPYSEYKFMSKDGYNYIDFIDGAGGREYMYTLPTSVLYKVHQTALALSVKNMKNYWGSGYRLFKYGLVYLHIVPYKPNASYVGSKLLCTKYSLDYKQEISAVVSYWQRMEILANLTLTRLEDGTNLALMPTTVGYNEFVPVETLAVSDTLTYGEDDGNEGVQPIAGPKATKRKSISI